MANEPIGKKIHPDIMETIIAMEEIMGNGTWIDTRDGGRILTITEGEWMEYKRLAIELGHLLTEIE